MKNFYHHLSQGPEIQKVDEDLLGPIQNALEYLLGPSEDWWYAEECYQTLRNDKWHEVHVLNAKLEGEEGVSLGSDELDLASRVVECAEHLRLRSGERSMSTITGVGALAGLAVAIIGIVTFFK